MDFDDVRKSWQSEFNRPVAAAELEQLFATVQQRYCRLEKNIHSRDLREILAALFVAAVFAALWPIVRSSLIGKLGIVVIIVSAAVVIWVLHVAGKPNEAPLATSVLESSRQRLAWLDRQIRLLRSIIWWYVAPLELGGLLFGWGLTEGTPLAFWPIAVVFLVVAVAAVWLNRRAVRVELLPVRQQVAELIAALESEGGASEG